MKIMVYESNRDQYSEDFYPDCKDDYKYVEYKPKNKTKPIVVNYSDCWLCGIKHRINHIKRCGLKIYIGSFPYILWRWNGQMHSSREYLRDFKIKLKRKFKL